ncbi:MAG TPA: TonB-dependent receptor, partial [Vicinamibacterales bacterium]|nr:TonB-dependent receptor [Vicinamibacterales bacterium]
LALSPGSYPPRYGRHLGAEVNIQTRQGDRSQFRARAGLSGTSATAVAEGPIGERGSWLVSARRSYLDLLLNRLDDGNNLAFGFTDGQVKVALDLTARNHVEALVNGGTSQFDESANNLGANDERRVTGVTWLGSASWRYAPSSKFMVTQRVYATGLGFNNVNNAARVLDDAQFDDAGWRADATWVPASGWIVEAGGDAVRMRGRHLVNRALNDADFLSTVNSFRASEITQSAYAQVTMSAMPRLRVSPAVRVDRSPSGSSSPASPSIAVDIELHRATKLRAGTGLYQQFPDFEQTYGLHGADALRPQRARHVDAGIAQQLPRNVSLEVTWFARIENDILWARDAEPRRLPSGSVLQARGDARFANALHGKAHGAEAVVRRDAPAGLAGWIGYAYGRHEYTDQLTGAQFFADQDQRHSVSMFGRYALSNRATLGAKFRYGSNYPRVGYIREASAAVTPQLFGGGVPLFYEVGETRNSLRLPAYARLDLRADRTLTWRGRRVTLFAEIANLLNRSNLRNVPYDVDRTGRVFGGTGALMPILPSAGFVVEF